MSKLADFMLRSNPIVETKEQEISQADRLWLAWFNEIRATVYPSDKVGKVMFTPKPLTPKVNFQAEQVELFSVPISGGYYE